MTSVQRLGVQREAAGQGSVSSARLSGGAIRAVLASARGAARQGSSCWLQSIASAMTAMLQLLVGAGFWGPQLCAARALQSGDELLHQGGRENGSVLHMLLKDVPRLPAGHCSASSCTAIAVPCLESAHGSGGSQAAEAQHPTPPSGLLHSAPWACLVQCPCLVCQREPLSPHEGCLPGQRAGRPITLDVLCKVYCWLAATGTCCSQHRGSPLHQRV